MAEATLTIRITHNALTEMQPALDDAGSSKAVEMGYGALIDVALAIKNGRQVKGGVEITLSSREEIEALRDEAKYRAYHTRCQAQDAWDRSERMMYIGIARGFDSIVKKTEAVLAS